MIAEVGPSRRERPSLPFSLSFSLSLCPSIRPAEQIASFRTKKRNVLSWQASLVDINSSHGRSGAS